jgi:uncharacterized protein (DUF2249 family)
MTLYDDPHATADTDELDVRQIPKSQRHPMIFARFDALAAGESFVLVNSHDPIHLREEFARDRPGAYDWRYLEGSQSDRLWRIRIVRITEPGWPASSEATTSSTLENPCDDVVGRAVARERP